MDILEIGSSAISGGLLGTVGTAVGRVTGFFEQSAANKQERERWAHELRLEEARASHASASAQASQAADLQSATYAGLNESLQSDAALDPGFRWVSAVRALVRPVLTPLLWVLYLVVFFTIMSGSAERYLEDGMESEFIAHFISNIAFTASAATLCWFGDRTRPLTAIREQLSPNGPMLR